MTYEEYSKTVIKNSGGRITATKIAVIEALNSAKTPLTPYQLANKINKNGKQIDVVTAYRILEIFLKLSLTHKSDKGFVRCFHHECTENKHCHHLFTCQKCSNVEEIHLDDHEFLNNISDKFKELLIESHNFQFSGLCKQCKKLLSFFAIAILFLSACGNQNAQNEAKPLNVLTTIPPLYSLTSHILEEVGNVEIINLISPNTNVHTFALSPKDAKSINDADVIIVNGLELEEFLENSLEDSKALIVQTAEGVALLKNLEEEGHGQFDPHVWLSPENAKIQATNIANALKHIDPTNANIYDKNLLNLKTELDQLNEDAKSTLASLDIQPYIVFHDAYQYFERDFDVHSAAFLEEFAGKEPSAQYLAEVIEIIKENGIKVIFTEPQFAPKLVQTLAQDYNLEVGELDPLGQEVSSDGYFKLIENNISAFQKTFKQK